MLKSRYLTEPVALIIILLCSYVLFQNSIASAIHIWTISEIFNHCFLVLPVSLFLIYRKRFELYNSEIKPFYPAFLAIFGILFIQVFAEIGDIKVLSHLALFTFIPFSIIAFIGLQSSKLIAFPLIFILLAVPIGEELIPFLQSITADMSVAMVRTVGIPVFKSGLYIDIPAGKFLVAEACSGISFLISSIAFGSLYAYLSFETNKAKIGFVILSIAVPIIANSIRVFGIISIAHVSGMKYAVGADHLIYGWFFYLLVLILLFALGERLSKNSKISVLTTIDSKHISWTRYNFLKPSSVLIILLTIGLVWQTQATRKSEDNSQFEFSIPNNSQVINKTQLDSVFIGATKTIHFATELEQTNYQVSIGAYSANSKGEAISSLNELFDKKLWSIAGYLPSIELHNVMRLPVQKLVSSHATQVGVIQFYIVNRKLFSSSTKAKLYETYVKTIGQQEYSFKVIISYPLKHNEKQQSLGELILQLQNSLLNEVPQ